MPIDKLRSITTFVRTVELGNMSKAAYTQQISPQAASKALGQLEAHLGIRLFHRTTRSMSLTEEGERLFEAVKPSLIGLEQAIEFAKKTHGNFAGPLKIVGPRTVLLSVIGPVLDEYSRLYPEVQPDVRLDDKVGNWVEDQVDVGFRLGNPPQDGVIMRRLFPMQLVICASPSYLYKHGSPNHLNDLDSHRCSAFRRSSDGRVMPWSVKVGDNIVEKPVRPALSTNDEAFELRAVLAGEVLGQLAVPTVAPYIRSGKLTPILLEHTVDNLGLYIYYGSRVAQPTRVRSFLDLAIERLTNNQEFVLSPQELLQASIASNSFRAVVNSN